MIARMADLNAMVIFAKVIEAGSFSEAARRLKMPVSTVSRRIADLEDQLGIRLLERSTRNLRLTDIGAEILEHALRGAEVLDAVEGIVSDQLSEVTGTLKLSAPPSISDSLISPIVSAFQISYPAVRIQILITDRYIDHIAEGVDLAFRVGTLKDSSLVARKVLSYRRRLVASPQYLERFPAPQRPLDLLDHRVLAFAHWRTESEWRFTHIDGAQEETVSFIPHLGINDFSGVTAGLLAGVGIGDLSPLVQPDLIADGRLVEVMPEWRFPTFDLCLIHLGNRHMPRAVRVFKEFAAGMAPKLFPSLPV
jgi:DNA-binding transcriptional LysR family regulator